jgi:hypothetical protein
MPLKSPSKNTSQVKVVKRGRSTEYSWKRHHWQFDIRFGYLFIVGACLAILGKTAYKFINFAVTGKLYLDNGGFLMLGLALYSPVWISKYAKKFIDYCFETKTLEVSGRKLRLSSWPFQGSHQFEATKWIQLYVTPSEELRAITNQGEHHVIATGPVPDLQFIESELERCLKIENVKVDGEAWDLTTPAVISPLHPLIERQQSDDRLKLSVRKRSINPPSFTFAVLWLFPHYFIVSSGLNSSNWWQFPFMPMMFPTSWVGYFLLYYWWAERSNKMEFFVDQQNFQLKVGPVPIDRNALVPLAQVREVRFISVNRRRPKSRQTDVVHQLELLHGTEKVDTILLASSRENPDILRSLQSELNGSIQALRSKHPQWRGPESFRSDAEPA